MDVISDFITIIRNGIMASKSHVIAPYSSTNASIADILCKEGFVKDVVVAHSDAGHKMLKLFLKYVDGESAIHEIKRVSKPSRRMYAGVDRIKPVIGGLGVSIVSTNKGVISHKAAKKFGVGGEVLCTVW